MLRKKATTGERKSSVEKVEQILQGAMQEFLAHGFAATSMDRVAATAGVSKATVYSHFTDKEGLFKALIERLARQKFHSLFGSEPLEGEPSEVLRQVGSKALQKMSQDREHCALMRLVIGESARFPELAKVYVRATIKPVLEALTQYLASHRELKITDPEAIASILVGLLIYFHITQDVLHGKDVIPMQGDRIINTTIDLMIKSCR